MRSLPADSVDAIVSDPPYGLAFMGKEWDHGVPGVEFWTEALRVAKPGAHLVAFGGTRTFHRLAVAIEDAGWEVRDCLSWLYGSGFPKSLDVGKAIDKRGGAVADFSTFRDAVREAMKRTGVTRAQLQDALGNHMLSHYLTAGSQPAVPNLRDYRIIRDTVDLGSEFDALFADEAEREVVGRSAHKSGIANGTSNHRTVGGTIAKHVDITRPATDAAKQWDGWGTALKPAFEPIVLARKPLVGTVAANVTQYGTGGINVDGCRLTPVGKVQAKGRGRGEFGLNSGWNAHANKDSLYDGTLGRWPANVCLDEDAAAMFPESRYFYTAKASRREREAGDVKNLHPTVKPIALMRWLCRLVTPPGGLVLDPFNGSGSTGCAAVLEGFRYLGAELDAEYVEIARKRIAHWAAQTPDPDLFG
jgi:site-specific DNA-methyltransferase (adenine-specific)